MPKPAGQSKSKSKSKIKKEIIFFCSCCAAIIVLLITGFNLQSYLTQDRVLGTKTENEPTPPNQEKIFWENFLKDNPRYFDGWLELARIYDEEGNIEAKEQALNYAQDINPNSERLQIMK